MTYIHLLGRKILCSLEHREGSLKNSANLTIEIINTGLNALLCMIDQKLLVVSHSSRLLVSNSKNVGGVCCTYVEMH